MNNNKTLNLYNKYKLALELIYNHIAEGIRIRMAKLTDANKEKD